MLALCLLQVNSVLGIQSSAFEGIESLTTLSKSFSHERESKSVSSSAMSMVLRFRNSEKEAIIRLQSVVRGHFGRRIVRAARCAAVAATSIERVYRGEFGTRFFFNILFCERWDWCVLHFYIHD